LLAIASLTAFVVDSESQRACTAVEQAQVIKYRAEIERVMMASRKSGVPYWKDIGGLRHPDCYPAGAEPVTLASIPAKLEHASRESIGDLVRAVIVLAMIIYGFCSLLLQPLVSGVGRLLAAVYRRVTRGRAHLQGTV
jgi:hypothetical protein